MNLRLLSPVLGLYGILLVSSCTNTSDENIKIYKELDRGLMLNNGTIDSYNKAIFKEFEKKLAEPVTRYRTEKWLPLATTTSDLCISMVKHLDSLKYQIKKRAGLEIKDGVEHYEEGNLKVSAKFFDKEYTSASLQYKLISLRKSIISLDPEVEAVFKNVLPIDTTKMNWENIPVIASIAKLSKLQCDIISSENMVISFMNRKIGCLDCGDSFDIFSALRLITNSHLKQGETTEIIAGVGAFSSAAKPDITINGRKIGINAEGYASYTLIAKGKPGKYYVPVKVRFMKPDGTLDSLFSKIEYFIETPCPDQ